MINKITRGLLFILDLSDYLDNSKYFKYTFNTDHFIIYDLDNTELTSIDLSSHSDISIIINLLNDFNRELIENTGYTPKSNIKYIKLAREFYSILVKLTNGITIFNKSRNYFGTTSDNDIMGIDKRWSTDGKCLDYLKNKLMSL